jgi:hypothetical protein
MKKRRSHKPLVPDPVTDKLPPGWYRPSEALFGILYKRDMQRDEELRDPVAHRKRIAAAIDLEIVKDADKLRKQGVSNPVTQAKEKAAKRWDHDNGEALDRWLRRHR